MYKGNDIYHTQGIQASTPPKSTSDLLVNINEILFNIEQAVGSMEGYLRDSINPIVEGDTKDISGNTINSHLERIAKRLTSVGYQVEIIRKNAIDTLGDVKLF